MLTVVWRHHNQLMTSSMPMPSLALNDVTVASWRHRCFMTSQLLHDILNWWRHHYLMTSLPDNVIIAWWRHHCLMTSSLPDDVIIALWRHYCLMTSSLLMTSFLLHDWALVYDVSMSNWWERADSQSTKCSGCLCWVCWLSRGEEWMMDGGW